MKHPWVKIAITTASVIFMLGLSLQTFYFFPKPFTFDPEVWTGLMKHQYSAHAIHKATAGALMEGHLSFPYLMTHGFDHDLQVYNGAVYTHWGYGVPLLQLPFHAAWRLFYPNNPLTYFPDRIIFAFYLTAVTVFLFFSLRTLLLHRCNIKKEWLADLLTLFLETAILTASLYWIMTIRFIIYEETISYLVLAQLAVIASYIRYAYDKKQHWLYLTGILLGFGLLIRPTGLFYAMILPACFFLLHRDKRALFKTGLVIIPFLIAWLSINLIKTGNLFSPGYQNSTPGIYEELEVVRFGSPCPATVGAHIKIAWELFYALFLGERPLPTWLNECGFFFLEFYNSVMPFLGLGTLFLLIGILLFYFSNLRERTHWRHDLLLPFIGLGIIFTSFVSVRHAFAYRYAGDLWPFIILSLIQFLLFSKDRIQSHYIVGALITLPLFFLPQLTGPIEEQKESILRTVDPSKKINYNQIGSAIVFDAWHVYKPRTLPRQLSCKDGILNYLPYDRAGWTPDCHIGRTTNLYFGIPQKESHDYSLILKTETQYQNTIRAFINGKIYTGHWNGKAYVVPFQLDREKMKSPNILVTVEWAPASDESQGVLLKAQVK